MSYTLTIQHLDFLMLKKDRIQTMKEGGFKLRKWNSNTVKLMNKINRDENINCSNSSNEFNRTKVLGISWDLETDTIIFLF